MGRQQYLERLALGRSPFEDPSTNPGNETAEADTIDGSRLQDGERYEQQYDSKGRPINPRTEERNGAMRNAQNAVLALVGVVESKDESVAKERPLREAREQMLEAEQECGENLSLLVEVLHPGLTWWPETLIARVQAGVYSSSSSVGDILLHELGTASGGGLRGFLAALTPGLLPYYGYKITDRLVAGLCSDAVGSLQTTLSLYLERRAARKYLKSMATVVMEALCITIGVALMPLQYFAATQKLGLSPTWPLLPSWPSFLPTRLLSTHNYIWTSAAGSPRLRVLSSPGVLLLLQNCLTRYQGDEETHSVTVRTPIAAQFTNFGYPTINTPTSDVREPNAFKDPLGRVLYNGYILRTKILKWFGWELEFIPSRPRDSYDANYLPTTSTSAGDLDDQTSSSDEDSRKHHVYRSTSLSQGPAKYLAERIDVFFMKMLMLPFESLVLRAITDSYLASSLPKTSLGMTAMHTYYTPFGGGPFGLLRGSSFSAPGWSGVGSYLSKLGLSLALHCSAEIGIFCILYRLHRWQGLRNFDWGSAG